MYRTNTCGDLRITDINSEITLSGWVHKIRKMGGMTFIDLRDRSLNYHSTRPLTRTFVKKLIN